jgi:aspartyl-tRNA(Asn)/glutamyl-tRNA(Gln) amidotransferase subunit B
MPGALPVINREAVAQTIRAGLALNCEIAEDVRFERKNYTYPDLPKGYQITQYELPQAVNGWLEIDTPAGPKRIGITRAHLEEDTGKLVHENGVSLVDYNRAGVPLLEIVSEPDMRSIDEVNEYLTRLRQLLIYIGASTGDLEKGAMRMEANVSLRPVGSQELGTKVEIKNLNSFRAVRNALAYEIARQERVLRAGGQVEQVTLGWLEQEGRTYVQRTKEDAHDYRYFPEPDLPPLHIDRAWVEELAADLPELPRARRQRFVEQYGLSLKEADILTAERPVADYFDALVAEVGDALPPRKVANWVMGDLFRLVNASGQPIDAIPVTPAKFAGLLKLLAAKTINANTASQVLKTMFRTGEDAQTIVEREGLAQVSDEGALAGLVDRILAEHPDEVARYRAGKTQLFGWFVGQVMRETRGKANPNVVRKLLQERLQVDH